MSDSTPLFEDPSEFDFFRAKGRKFLEDGFWVYIVVGGSDYYVKVTEEHYKNIAKGVPFEVHHPMAIQLGQPPVFLPQMFGTVGPWNVQSTSFWSNVHPKLQELLDKQVRVGLSGIVEAKAGDVPSPKKLELVQ